MTLLTLKKNLKLIFLLSFLFFYGVVSYQIGKYSLFSKIFQLKSSKTESNPNKSIEKPLPYADVQSGSVISSYVKLCSNTFYSFEIAYPRDWFTTYNIDEQKCTFFAPFSFVIPTQKEGNFVPIKIEPIKIEDWTSTVKFYGNPNDFQNVISDQSIQINDKSVEKIKAFATGEGSLPRGLTRITYLVFSSQTPLAISYQQLDQKEDVTQMEKILKEMVSSLRYF